MPSSLVLLIKILMVVKKNNNRVGCSTIAANKNADETSVCAIAALHHKNMIMPPTPIGSIIQIFLTDRNNYDLATFANLPDPGGVVFMMMVSIVLLVTAAVAAAWYVLPGSSKKKLCTSLETRKLLFERKKIKTLAINNCPSMPLSSCQIQLWLFAGFFAMAITAQCSVGEFTDAGECKPCSPGTFQEAPSSLESCTDCPTGWYQDAPKKPFCLPCVPGTFNDEVKKTSCVGCAPGMVRLFFYFFFFCKLFGVGLFGLAF